MIYFLGDSFTWGQGLYFEKWEKLGYGNMINKHSPDIFAHECLSYDDHKFRKEFHFPNLVAKHFDRDYVTDWHNGGTNYDLLKYIACLPAGAIQDLVVVQFTSPLRMFKPLIGNTFMGKVIRTREDLDREELEIIDTTYKRLNVESIIKKSDRNENIKEVYKNSFEQIYLVNKFINKNMNGKTWIGFSWWPETGEIIKNFFKENYVPLYYKGEEYNSFESLLNKDILSLKNKMAATSNIKCFDEHFSTDGHKVIADSIIKKINQDNLLENIRLKSLDFIK